VTIYLYDTPFGNERSQCNYPLGEFRTRLFCASNCTASASLMLIALVNKINGLSR